MHTSEKMLHRHFYISVPKQPENSKCIIQCIQQDMLSRRGQQTTTRLCSSPCRIVLFLQTRVHLCPYRKENSQQKDNHFTLTLESNIWVWCISLSSIIEIDTILLCNQVKQEYSRVAVIFQVVKRCLLVLDNTSS